MKKPANKRILFIEDYPIIQEMYGEALKTRGFKVDTASDGEEAVKLATKHHYDFILVDLLLPKLNGINVLEKFQESQIKSRVIVLSDFDPPEVRTKAFELGIRDYLLKVDNPPGQLADKLDSYLSE